MKNQTTKNTLVYLFAAIIISVITYWRWFFTSEIYTWGDWGFQYQETVKEWFNIPQVWYKAFLGGVDVGLPLYLPARFFYGGLAHFMSTVWFDRIVFLFPCILVASISVFFLVKEITKNNLSALIGSIVYILNSYILTLNTGHLTLSNSFSLGPIIFIFFRRSLIKKSFFYAILAGLVGLLASSYEIRGFYLTAWILLLYFIYNFIPTFIKNRRDAYILIPYTVVPFIMVALFNSYWILPFTQTISDFAGIAFDRPIFGKTSNSIFKVLTLFHPSWTGSHVMDWTATQLVTVQNWFIPFFVFMGFWFNKKNRDIIFWTVIALIGVFLTKLGGEPFPNLYEFLYYHLPGFNAFRESSKFTYFVVLSYSILIGAFVNWLISSKLKLINKILLTFFICTIFLVNAIPVVNGQLARLLTPRHIPEDYKILKNLIQSQNEFFRVLYFPSDSRWGYWDNTHPRLSTNWLVQNNWKEFNNYTKTGLEYSAINESSEIFKKTFSDKLLDSSGIKYIVVPPEDKENEEIFIFPNKINRQDYISSLEQINYLHKININTKELVIFENLNYKPLFYDNNEKKVEPLSISPTLYKINPDSLQASKITFNELYHPGWKIRLGEFSWIESLIQKNYFLSDSYHTKTEFGYNQFTIPKNNQSSITLYFYPQSLANLGSLISILTVFISVILLYITWKLKY